jgi:hypothetical protein
MVSAHAAQCMPSNTTLDSQQEGRPSRVRLKADHSWASSSTASRSRVEASANGSAATGPPGGA